MLVLAIDTALDACSVALVRDGAVLQCVVEPMARGQAERLAPLVRDTVASAGLAFSDIERIGVTKGPGAFTGLRIGLSFARGLGLALNRPCLGFSTLEALAQGASQIRTLAAIHVAGSVFAAAWDGRQVRVPPCRCDVSTLVDQLDGDWTVTGPGADQILALRPDWIHIQQDLVDPIVLAHMTANTDPASAKPTPLYLRDVEAKLKGGILPPPQDA
jgi:tRNA threonylcarbamoyladenosine biosynthesis protein TsaB